MNLRAALGPFGSFPDQGRPAKGPTLSACLTRGRNKRKTDGAGDPARTDDPALFLHGAQRFCPLAPKDSQTNGTSAAIFELMGGW